MLDLHIPVYPCVHYVQSFMDRIRRRRRLEAYLPDVELSAVGDTHSSIREGHAFDAYDASHHALQEARKASFLAPEPTLLEPLLDAFEFVETLCYKGRNREQAPRVLETLNAIDQAKQEITRLRAQS